MQRRSRSRSPSAPRMPVPGAVDGGRSPGSSPTARSVLFLALVALFAADLVAVDELTMAGAAKVDVTPEIPVVLAGYAARTTEHEGVDGKLWARALAFGSELPAVVIAVDNAGVPASVIEQVSSRLEASVGLSADRLVVCSSHTHTAPNLDGYAPIIWRDRLSEEQARHATQYTRRLVERLVEVAEEALESRRIILNPSIQRSSTRGAGNWLKKQC